MITFILSHLMTLISSLLLIILYGISLIGGLITTPPGYYDLIKFDNYQQFPNRESNIHNNYPQPQQQQKQQQNFYYPNICSNAIRNNLNGTLPFRSSYFPGSIGNKFNNLYITKGTTMTLKSYDQTDDATQFLNILCIEGSLNVEKSDMNSPLIVSAIIILPGGSFSSKRPIIIRDLYKPNSLIDPMGYIPGILSLGGNLTLSSSPNKLIYHATRINSTSLSIPGLIGIDLSFQAIIFSELFPLGVQIASFNVSNGKLVINGTGISGNDKNINVAFYRDYSSYQLPMTSGSSIYITGNSNVQIENYFIQSFGKTTNQEYNDTILIFDPNNPNVVIDIIIGTNQRFRSSLFIENSNNVNIIGSVIYEIVETRSPLVISESKVNIQGCLFASKSGSSIISQYGTELITSSNNVFYLSKTSNNSGSSNQIQSSATSYMDYGNEGNGIYSLSPNITSTSDVFIGHSNAFNFNFISKRPTVTGFNHDCFAPCTPNSVLVSSFSQFPIDFKIKNASLIQLSLSLGSNQQLLININNGNHVTRYFTINGTSISNSIKLNLNNSVLTLSNVNITDGFNIQGTVGKLNIINSTISSTSVASNLYFSKLISNLTVISNSYIRGELESNVIYKGNSYHYDIENLNIKLPILSTFPNDTYQINVYSKFKIMVQLGSSSFNGNGIKCEFISINSNVINSSIPIDSNGKCTLPLSITNEGTTNLKVIISSNSTPSTYYYSLILPTIYSFEKYLPTTSWKIVPITNTTTSSNLILKSYIHLVTSTTQIDSQFNKECIKSNGCEILSNQIKIESNLPSESSEYLPIGISTNTPFKSLNINLSISKLKISQIQLYFTSFNPSNSNPSPLSIYLNNQPISILESSNQQHFKKVFYFENINQLDTVQISIISRGDIYLTGSSIYSSYVSYSPNPIIPFSDNFNPTILYIIIFVGVGLLLTSIIGIFFAFKTHFKRNEIKKEIELKVITIQNKANQKEMEEISDDEFHVDHSNTDTGTISLKTTSFLTSSSISYNKEDNNNESHTNNNYEIKSKNKINNVVVYNKIKKNDRGIIYGTFPLTDNLVPILKTNSQQISSSSSSDIYKVNADILMCTQNSQFYQWNSNEFPISFSKQILEFDSVGKKCKINKTLRDHIEATNKTDQTIELTILLPTNNGAGYCTAEKTFYTIYAHQTIVINFSILLHCTTKWLEKLSIQIDGFGYTFLKMNLESIVTSKLDYRELEFEQVIGQCSLGIVYKGIWRNKIVAIKLINANIDNIKRIHREIETIGRIIHSNCVQMIGCVVSPDNLCIVNQFVPLGSLGDLIHKSDIKLSLKQKIRISLDIANGCQFLHSNGITHRDLKPDNVLVVDLNCDAPICVKISDFGISKVVNRYVSLAQSSSITSKSKLPIYQSNEILDQKSVNNSTDVYSFGMLLYELMAEELPFSDIINSLELSSLIIAGVRPIKGMNQFDNDISSLISKCWVSVPDDRPTFNQIIIDLNQITERLN